MQQALGYSLQQAGPLVSTSGIWFCLVFNNVGDESVLLKEKTFRHAERMDPSTLTERTMRR